MAIRNKLNRIPRYREKDREAQKRARAFQRSAIAKAKSEKGCEICGENHPACLQFHHIDRSTKLFTITQAVVMKVSPQKLIEEIKKCRLLCANCHAKLHWKERESAGLPVNRNQNDAMQLVLIQL